MPSKPKKRKKKKSSLRPAPILVLLLIGNLAAGMWFSPITAASRVVVLGARDEEKMDIARRMRRLENKPYVQVSGREVESDLAYLSRIREASYHQNLFGRAVLELDYRQPVASIVGFEGLALCADGVIYREDASVADLPRVELRPEAMYPSLSISGVAELPAVAEVCQRVRSLNINKNTIVEVASNGTLCLNINGGGKIQLGSSDDLDLKFKRLQAFLDERNGVLSDIKEINLTSPANAALTPKAGGG